MDTSSLMEQIISNENLNRAYLQVVRNKGAEGVDGMKYKKIERERPYYGTERDIFRNNPKMQENRNAVDDIFARQKVEYIKKHGHSW